MAIALNREPVFTALTRPQMFAGVTYTFFVINALAPTFGATADMGQAFKLAAYAPTAAWIGAIFNIVPVLGQIIAIAAAFYSLYLLYVGLPKLMRPPEDKVVVYTLSIIGVMIESHLVAGRQDLVVGRPLTYGQSITDACLGWDDSVTVLDTLAAAVRQRRDALTPTRAGA